MQRRGLKINEKDNVICVLEDCKKGDTVLGVTLLSDIEFAHKVCIKDLKKGESVIKYGEEIGYMLNDAKAGSWIHSHNMGCDRGKK